MNIEILIDSSASVMFLFNEIEKILHKIKEVNLSKKNKIIINFYNNDEVLYKMNIDKLDELTIEKIHSVCNRPSGNCLFPLLSVLTEKTNQVILISDFYEPALTNQIETKSEIYFIDIINDKSNIDLFLKNIKIQDNIKTMTQNEFMFYLDKEPLYHKLNKELENPQNITKKIKI